MRERRPEPGRRAGVRSAGRRTSFYPTKRVAGDADFSHARAGARERRHKVNERALRQALDALALGLRVFPINAWKRPALRSAHPSPHVGGRCRGECGQPGHGVYDATHDPARLRALFELAPGATGYGVACGVAPHWLLGLDLDRKNGVDGVVSLAELGERHGFAMPETITTATPSNGLHKWLTVPAEARIPNSVGTLAPGIDVRGSGAYLVGPGSWTPKGAYRLTVEPSTPIAPVPAGLLALLERPARPARGEGEPRSALVSRRITGLVTAVLEAKPGRRNDVLFWSACRMAEAVAEGSIAESEGRELLLSAAERIGLDYREADSAIDSAFRTAMRRG